MSGCIRSRLRRERCRERQSLVYEAAGRFARGMTQGLEPDETARIQSARNS